MGNHARHRAALLLNRLILAAGTKGRESADRDDGRPVEDPITDADIDAIEAELLALFDTSYTLHGYLVYEGKFGGHCDFHPKDELPAGDFLKHRQHTPVYVRADGVMTVDAPAVFDATGERIQELARRAGFNLEPTPNMLYTVRGNHAQLVNFARLVLGAH